MARYIEETDVYKLVEPRGMSKVHCSQIDELPRADVVPKSEVERLYYNLQAVLEERAETKQEIAREIFGEIEEWFASNGDVMICSNKKFAEIKNKFTEGV